LLILKKHSIAELHQGVTCDFTQTELSVCQQSGFGQNGRLHRWSHYCTLLCRIFDRFNQKASTC